ncbi:hypothetical protein [Natronobacterium texcoconense]|uniref:hypothetical protein n=1 Tax=Natronobacterium texcoconense TaxID=1095778 RepID=UPI000B8A10AF|nr:hypothetical protein [Natronobacterium texcoconense]
MRRRTALASTAGFVVGSLSGCLLEGDEIDGHESGDIEVVVDGDHVVTTDGTTYDERDSGTEITFEVDGEEVDPTDRRLHDGDSLSLEVTTETEE